MRSGSGAGNKETDMKRLLARSTLAAAALAASLAAGGALAQDAAALQVRSWAATCANCHGTDGRAVDGAAVPGLAGMPASYLVDQLKTFKAGTRPATVMHQLAKGFSDAQIDQLAAYFAAQKK
jgi:sulfide dehydrogenase cytochrome subunit